MSAKHKLEMLCHGVRCGLRSICDRFHQMSSYCPNRQNGQDEPAVMDHCDEEMRNGFIHADQ